MADSLVIAGAIELLGGGVASTIPACAGAIFRLGQNFDLGAPQPTTDFVASLILDGERPFGRRASNRTITLPVVIIGTSRQNLAAAREVLEQAIDQDQWTLTWTRDPGPGGTPLPLIIDCFRAQPTAPQYRTLLEKQLLMMQLTLTIPALPYGRSDTQQQISFASPVPASPPPPPAAVTLDTYSSIASTQCTQSTQSVVGPYTACWDPDSPLVGDPGGQQTPFSYGPVTFTSPQNLTGLSALQLWLGFGSRYYPNLDYRGRTSGVQVAVTLTDISGNTLSFSRPNLRLAVTPVAQAPVFTRVTVPFPSASSVFDYSAVASYEMVITNRQHPVPRLGWVTCYLDHLQAVPPSVQAQPVTRGYLYTLSGLLGTARAPVSLSFTQPPTAGTPAVLSTAGAGTYTVPAGTAWLDVTNIGGGGPGATMTAAGTGGGGAGAECAQEPDFPASPGQQIPYIVGAGGQPGSSPTPGQASVFGPGPSGSLQVVANGGGAAAENSPTGGVPGQGSGNSVHYPGGAGRTNPAGTVAGGGGSSAGPSGPGNYPVGTAQQVFTTPGTTMWTCPAGVTQILAIPTGAGGSGAVGSGFLKGAGGGGGECRQGYVPVTPGTSYPVVVGAGGAAVSGSAQNGNPGGSSSFTGDGGSEILAEGGQGGEATWSGGQGAGGSGGSGGTGWPGGQGGSAYPYAGGGGSSAAPGAAGSPAGGVAPPGGGQGGAASGAGAGNGQAGTAPGGGGGGTYDGGYSSGAGANGQVILVYPASSGAPTNAGGAAVAGGGAGGQGGASPGTAGSPGSAPGGGGGGADSGGSTVQGGVGATGQITVTPYASEPFKSLIVHRPPLGAPKTFQPLVSVGAGGDAPDGTHQYAMPQLIGGVNATFQGTYSIYLIAASWSGGSSSTTDRTITVTVTQYEYGGGASYTLSTAPVVLSPSQVTNGIVTAGVLTLPVKQVAADNTGGYYTVSVTDSNTADRFYDLIFLDTQGSSVIINEPASGYVNYFIDEADPVASIGAIMGSQFGRPDAISVTDVATISGPGLCVEPADGDNQLFVYSADGVAPSVACSFSPRYFFDRFE
jgi:hypothetical protein